MVFNRLTEHPPVPIDQEYLQHEIDLLLNVLGEGKIDSVPYDTSWIARLAQHYPQRGFDQALDWIRDRQHPNGSWGGEFLHYHDRFISTLSSIIALRICGNDRWDAERIRHGETYLWREVGRLHVDADDTIGFPVVAVSLVQEALTLGLDIPENIYHNVAVIEQKLNLLGSDPRRWRDTSMSFSLEAARLYYPAPEHFQNANFVLGNGSVGASPAATAAYLLHSRSHDERALNYLQHLVERQGDGGAQDMNPIDVFEIGWVLNQLRWSGVITPDNPTVRRLLDKLWSLWSQEHGISFSEYFPVPDLDDTAVVFALLRWGGYPVTPDVFAQYEGEKVFHCYRGETNPSLSVNVRTLGALQLVRGSEQVEAWVGKISRMLRHYDLDHHLWFDKWHISPYYLTSVAMMSSYTVLDDLLAPRIKWILKTQQADGGWGYYGNSTLEETAYCLQALLFWRERFGGIDPAPIDAAARHITGRLDRERLPALYIGKCLYNPVHVVRSAVLGTLLQYIQQQGAL